MFAIGYAGAFGYSNKPQFQNLKYKGPLPCGLYSMGPAIDHSKLGPVAIPLQPSPENEMFDRGDFYIHGDNVINPGHGSDGCICAPRFARERLNASEDRLIEVVAYYPLGIQQT